MTTEKKNAPLKSGAFFDFCSMTTKLAGKAFNIIFSIGATCLSAIFLILIFPGFEMHYLAWIALVPLLLQIKKSDRLTALLSSLSSGLIFYSGLLWWTLKMETINPYNFSLVVLATSFYLGLFGFLAHYFQKKIPRWNALTFPATWVVLEYLRSHTGFLSFPWGILGYSQYSVFPVVWISAFTGVYGVSFIIVIVNTVLAEVIHSYLASQSKVFWRVPSGSSLKMSLSIFVGVIILFSLSFLYGFTSLTDKMTLPNLKIALVQGNVYTIDEKEYLQQTEIILQKYFQLTRSAAESKPYLIVWPSSSVPGRIPYDRMLVKMLSSLAQETGDFLLIGSAGFDKFNAEQMQRKRVANSAFLFSPIGKIIGRYDKVRLLPFDEYLPLRDYVKWPSWIVTEITDHHPGKEMTIFSMDKAKFGVLICWEYMFPDQFRKMAVQGVNFMVNMTNEGFTYTPAAHYQMVAMSVLRAVENHVSIARTSSTGVSCIIEPNGRITARVQDQKLNDVNIEGYLVTHIPLSSERTFYSRHGDWFVYILSVTLIGFILRNVISRKQSVEESDR